MPLSILEMEVDHVAGRDIQRIREVSTSCALTSIQSHPVKNVIALFLSEILYRTLRTNESDGRLFTYIYESICYLESLEDSISNFHIVFLINLSHYLGIYPNIDSYIKGSYFDLAGGVFVESVPMHRYYLDRRDGVIMLRLLRMTYVNMSLYTFSRSERVLILSRLLDYYRLHLSGFPEIRSLSVLQSLFT
jgi:DNA repair protein RecO (recombination protein O)